MFTAVLFWLIIGSSSMLLLIQIFSTALLWQNDTLANVNINYSENVQVYSKQFSLEYCSDRQVKKLLVYYVTVSHDNN